MIDKETLFSGNYSVSKATLRPQDLVPAFMTLLQQLSPEYHAEVVKIHPELEDGEPEDDSPFWETEDCSELIVTLTTKLDEYSPAGMYFGAHEGNESDFGYWKGSDYLEGLREVFTGEIEFEGEVSE